MKKLIVSLAVICGQLVYGQDLRIDNLVIGEKITFKSNYLNEERLLNVYLPNSYDKDSTSLYPVIYVLDGSIDEDFMHITGLVQFLSFPWVSTVPESIVVGIANVDRKRDFTYPSNNALDKDEFPTAGGSANFIKFLNEEVQTIVEENYRATKNTTIIGQSLGGLLATEILLKHPEYFDNYLIISPSLWWDDQSLLSLEMPKITPPKKIYVAVGKEGPTMESTTMRLIAKLQKLRKREWENTLIIDYDILNDLDHGNILHEAIYKAFIKFKMKETKD